MAILRRATKENGAERYNRTFKVVRCLGLTGRSK